MIAIIITTIVVLVALVALVVGGIMWDQQHRRDITQPESDDSIDQEIEQTNHRIQLHQLAIHQLRMRQVEREQRMLDRIVQREFNKPLKKDI